MLYKRAKEIEDAWWRWNVHQNRINNFKTPHAEAPNSNSPYAITREMLLELLEDPVFYAKALCIKKLDDERKKREHGLSGKFGVHPSTADV